MVTLWGSLAAVLLDLITYYNFYIRKVMSTFSCPVLIYAIDAHDLILFLLQPHEYVTLSSILMVTNVVELSFGTKSHGEHYVKLIWCCYFEMGLNKRVNIVRPSSFIPNITTFQNYTDISHFTEWLA